MHLVRISVLVSGGCLFLAGSSAANNLHDQKIRTIVAPLIDQSKLQSEPPPQARLKLSISDSKDMPAHISYRIEAVEKSPAAEDQKERTALDPGLYHLIIFEGKHESFRKKFIALPDLPSDLRLDYQKDSGFSLKQSLELPPLKFAPGKKKLAAASFPVLEYLAVLLQDEQDIHTLAIDVHTDSGGKEPRNLSLTQSRAEEVKTFLEKKGIDSRRLVARGLGSSQPIVPDSSPENRQKNRRVEYVLQSVENHVLLGKSR